MRRLRLVASSALLIFSYACSASAQEVLTLGRNAFAFHEDIFTQQSIQLERPAVIDVELFVELIGLPNLDKVNALRLQIRRSNGLGNAAGVFWNGYRTIVYDPAWAKTVSAEFYLVLGHEAGHHFCGHTIEGFKGDPLQSELDADRFAGASIRRFEIYHGRNFFDEVIASAARKYPEAGSSSHPPRALRIEALRSGYAQGSPCGNLAPVQQRGYTSGPR